MSEDDILATVSASTGRRWFGVLSVALLGALLAYVALARPPADPAWRLFLVLFGAGFLWMAVAMHRATAHRVELTANELRSSDGTCIALVKDIEAIDRGLFAFKPSNGFTLRLNAKAPGRWLPGLWWRLGRRVGIGGVTPGSQTKAMADILAVALAQRTG